MGLFGLGWWLVAKATAGTAILYILLVLGYRLTLHPLRQYPGPLLARLTHQYAAFHAVKRDLHLTVFQHHQEYGSVVRIGPDRLVFNTIEALRDIYLNPKVMKSDLYLVSKMNVGRNVFDTVDPKSAQRKRKMIGMPLAERSLRTFGPTITREISIFLEAIRDASEKQEPLDMSERCSWLVGDIVGQLAFGYKLKQQTEVTNRWLQPGMTMSSYRINTYMQAPMYFKLEPMLKFLLRKVRARYIEIVRTMIEERIAMKKDAIPDLYSHVVDRMGGEDGLDWDELWAEALLFILAGSTTSACAISGLFFYLSRYPECYKKLATEIRSSFDNVDEIDSGEKLRECEYLRACVNETLRLAPPASGLAWRQQIPGDKTPLVVDGHVVPPGTHLSVNLYAINHNEKYFPDPFVFRPERWLEGGAPKEMQDVMQKAFAPFLVGARSCPGKSLALTEINVTLARTIYSFDFEAAPGEQGKLGGGDGSGLGRGDEKEYQLYDVFSAMHYGPIIMFRARE